MQAGLAIDVNKEVFKVRDPRVEQLARGRLTAELFSKMIGPNDPFVLVDGCIYVLTEDEFYASRAVLPVNAMSEAAFKHVMSLDDLSFMHKVDADFILKAREDLPNCSACRYRRYKDEVTRLVKKYNIQLPETIKIGDLITVDKAVYPQVSAPVAPIVSILLQHMFRTDTPKRRDCIDCVEKHISQAYVLAGECVTGYPEHVSFVIAHLGEAIDEMPASLLKLREAVMFCLAKTKKDGKPFVPAYLLLPLINLARYELDQVIEDRADDITETRTESMDIDFTEAMADELSILPTFMLEALKRHMHDAITAAEQADRIAWEGHMATAAECIGQMAPALSNLLRNRRLLFIGELSVAAEGDWCGKDIINSVEKCLETTN